MTMIGNNHYLSLKLMDRGQWAVESQLTKNLKGVECSFDVSGIRTKFNLMSFVLTSKLRFQEAFGTIPRISADSVDGKQIGKHPGQSPTSSGSSPASSPRHDPNPKAKDKTNKKMVNKRNDRLKNIPRQSAVGDKRKEQKLVNELDDVVNQLLNAGKSQPSSETPSPPQVEKPNKNASSNDDTTNETIPEPTQQQVVQDQASSPSHDAESLGKLQEKIDKKILHQGLDKSDDVSNPTNANTDDPSKSPTDYSMHLPAIRERITSKFLGDEKSNTTPGDDDDASNVEPSEGFENAVEAAGPSTSADEHPTVKAPMVELNMNAIEDIKGK